jgi:hypothetical protein
VDKNLEQRARDLVALLHGDKNCGFMLMGGMVVARTQGAPYTDTPTPYDEADLMNAVELGLLKKGKATLSSQSGSTEWEWYKLT